MAEVNVELRMAVENIKIKLIVTRWCKKQRRIAKAPWGVTRWPSRTPAQSVVVADK